jgi:hypothetical protein
VHLMSPAVNCWWPQLEFVSSSEISGAFGSADSSRSKKAATRAEGRMGAADASCSSDWRRGAAFVIEGKSREIISVKL